MKTVAGTEVLIEVRNSGANMRQIGPRSKATLEPLRERKADIEAAIAEGVAIAQSAATRSEGQDGWWISEFEVTFGVTLSADAGVIVAKVGTEASLGIKLTIKRGPHPVSNAEHEPPARTARGQS